MINCFRGGYGLDGIKYDKNQHGDTLPSDKRTFEFSTALKGFQNDQNGDDKDYTIYDAISRSMIMRRGE
jgi:hypothetical protein